jgi:dynein heavy chain
LPGFFEKYIPRTFELLAENNLSTIVPVSKMCTVQSVCYLLEGLLDGFEEEDQRSADDIEALFAFEVMCAFCGPLTDDKGSASRKKFNNLWRSEFKKVIIPSEGHVLDYFFHVKTRDVLQCSSLVEEYVHVTEGSFSSIFVPTVNTTRVSSVIHQLVQNRHPVLLVGPAGTGKTQILSEYLKGMETEHYMYCKINMNYYTDSMALQVQLEAPVEKRSGKMFGPPGQKKAGLLY